MAGGIPTSFQIGSKTTPQAAATNYQTGASGKGTKWATNYLQSKKDPFEAASAAADIAVANFVAVGAAGIRAGLARVNKQQVATLVAQQGPTLYSMGITNKGTPRYAAAAAGLIPAIQQAAANLPARGDDAANEQRMILMRRAMKAMRGQFRAK